MSDDIIRKFLTKTISTLPLDKAVEVIAEHIEKALKANAKDANNA